MKKGMVLIMVLALAGIAKGAISVSPGNAANVPACSSEVIGIGIQNDDGSICFIYLGQTNIGQRRIYANSNTIQFFPDATTVAGLLLIGMHVRRRKTGLNLITQTI